MQTMRPPEWWTIHSPICVHNNRNRINLIMDSNNRSMEQEEWTLPTECNCIRCRVIINQNGWSQSGGWSSLSWAAAVAVPVITHIAFWLRHVGHKSIAVHILAIQWAPVHSTNLSIYPSKLGCNVWTNGVKLNYRDRDLGKRLIVPQHSWCTIQAIPHGHIYLFPYSKWTIRYETKWRRPVEFPNTSIYQYIHTLMISSFVRVIVIISIELLTYGLLFLNSIFQLIELNSAKTIESGY